MTDSFDHDVAEVLREAQMLTQQAQRAEAQAEAADAEVARELERLRAEHGVVSIEEAEALLVSKNSQLTAELANVRAALARAQKEVS